VRFLCTDDPVYPAQTQLVHVRFLCTDDPVYPAQTQLVNAARRLTSSL